MQEHDYRLFFEVLRWSLETRAIETSRPLQKMLSQFGADDFAMLWNRCRKLDSIDAAMLHRSVSAGQVESKLWMVDALMGVIPEGSYNICVLGGWLGWLPRLLHWRTEGTDWVRRMVLVDSDQRALRIAKLLHADLIHEKKLELVLADANEVPLEMNYHLIINTSCEHMSRNAWFDNVVPGRLLALQSTNADWEPDHSNCVPSLFGMKKKYPIEMTMYEGELGLERGSRFMTIGRK